MRPHEGAETMQGISYIVCAMRYFIYILAYSKVLSIGIKRKHKLQTATTARTGDTMKHAYWVSNELRAASRCHRPLKCILKILLLHCGVAQVECRIEWVGVLAYCAHTHAHTHSCIGVDIWALMCINSFRLQPETGLITRLCPTLAESIPSTASISGPAANMHWPPLIYGHVHGRLTRCPKMCGSWKSSCCKLPESCWLEGSAGKGISTCCD